MDLLSSAHIPVLLFFFHLIFNAAAAAAAAGRWDLLQGSIGVSAMHMQLLHNDRVIIFDRTDVGPSKLALAGGACRHDPNELDMKVDCTAHTAEYNVAANTFRPLTVLTDTWCSSGTVAPDGTLVQTGGFNDGDHNARTFRPCANAAACDWTEHQNALAVRRWYATNQILPDGRAIIIGGTGQFNYEFYPKTNAADAAEIPLPFLAQTHDPEENNLYPFVHLNIDGNLFIFANNRAILFDYVRNAVVRTYPEMPGGNPRNYPSTGSSVLLPLKPAPTEAEVLVCGGAPTGSWVQASQHGNFLPALATCGRIKITDAAPAWAMETMPMPRVMGDMVLLPSGEVLIINGAGTGAAGWEIGHNPVLAPVLYHPDAAPGTRFAVQAQGTVPRLYHSTAVLLRDGRVLVGGSNPHERYVFTNVEYPTELSLEAFSPEYLDPAFAALRPQIISPLLLINHGRPILLRFRVGQPSANGVSVTMASPAFATHSFSMNQRLLILETMKPRAVGGVAGVYEVGRDGAATAMLAPPGYYMVFVVNNGIPSEGVWAQVL
ncbi:Galactose oxidase [Ananas comosus]|uniref:Aldehyde oxidase GLOX n=1 Tax=Ananas comosus TaxID=4615 RepID=A0A199VU26_ANACO|nr:Galactose oxidase [Ananas comosus]